MFAPNRRNQKDTTSQNDPTLPQAVTSHLLENDGTEIGELKNRLWDTLPEVDFTANHDVLQAFFFDGPDPFFVLGSKRLVNDQGTNSHLISFQWVHAKERDEILPLAAKLAEVASPGFATRILPFDRREEVEKAHACEWEMNQPTADDKELLDTIMRMLDESGESEFEWRSPYVQLRLTFGAARDPLDTIISMTVHRDFARELLPIIDAWHRGTSLFSVPENFRVVLVSEIERLLAK